MSPRPRFLQQKKRRREYCWGCVINTRQQTPRIWKIIDSHKCISRRGPVQRWIAQSDRKKHTSSLNMSRRAYTRSRRQEKYPQHGQGCAVSRRSSLWPWKQSISVLDSRKQQRLCLSTDTATTTTVRSLPFVPNLPESGRLCLTTIRRIMRGKQLDEQSDYGGKKRIWRAKNVKKILVQNTVKQFFLVFATKMVFWDSRGVRSVLKGVQTLKIWGRNSLRGTEPQDGVA